MAPPAAPAGCPVRYAAIWLARRQRRARRRPRRCRRARSPSRQRPGRRRIRLRRPQLRALLCLRRIPSGLRPVPGPAADTATGTGTAGIVTAEPRSTRSPTGPQTPAGLAVGRDGRSDQPANVPPPRCCPAPGRPGGGMSASEKRTGPRLDASAMPRPSARSRAAAARSVSAVASSTRPPWRKAAMRADRGEQADHPDPDCWSWAGCGC